jgi:membrane protease YdiL (CAAX protease family)
MPATTPQSETSITETPLAPRWHTALIVSLIVLVAIAGTIMQMRGQLDDITPPPNSRIPLLYLPSIAISWALAFYCFRIGRKKSVLSELIGRKWTSARVALIDIVIGLSFLVFIDASETLYAHVAHVVPNPALAQILPQSLAEKLVWVLFAFSAGFCEEVVYRGYMRTQFTGFFRSVALRNRLRHHRSETPELAPGHRRPLHSRSLEWPFAPLTTQKNLRENATLLRHATITTHTRGS